MHSGDEVLPGLPLGPKGNDLRLREYGAGAAYSARISTPERHRPHTVNGANLQYSGHDLQESTGAGSTLVIHNEILHVPLLIHLDSFAVLATDINDRPG